MRNEGMTLPCGCPGTKSRRIEHNESENVVAMPAGQVSRLSQWPVQIKLVPVNAPYFNGAKLLIAADCTAYAYAAFHERFIKGHITLVGCPKLDGVDYADKLTEIIRENFDLRPAGIIKMLELRRPIYKQTAAYGHFGRHDLDLPWEKLDKVEVLKQYL